MVRDVYSFSRYSQFPVIDLDLTFAPYLHEIRLTDALPHVHTLSTTHPTRIRAIQRAQTVAVVGIARPMRRSPSVHNALVLNLRTGDANLDVRRRSPPLAISFSMFLYLFLALRFPFAARHYHCVSSLSELLQTCLLSCVCSLYPSPPNPPLYLSLTHSPPCASCRRCCHLTGDLLLATIRDE